jgi:hypothetical protein
MGDPLNVIFRGLDGTPRGEFLREERDTVKSWSRVAEPFLLGPLEPLNATKFHFFDFVTSRMVTMLRMNVSLMEYIRGEYDNLRSKIQDSETRITKELRDKAEKQAREASTMDET